MGGKAHVWRSQEMQSELLTLHNRYAWFVVYPLLLLALFAACGRGSGTAGDAASEDDVRDTGQTAVTAYVSATGTDSAAAEQIYGHLVAPTKAADGQLQAFPFPGLTVLAASSGKPELKETRPDKTKIWAVDVHVLTDSGALTYEQSVAETADQAYRVDALPGRVPPARQAEMPETQQAAAQFVGVEQGTAVYSTVHDFLMAWLTGDGDISRVADDTVPRFPQPPYSEVALETINASKVPDKIDGSITVYVSLIATEIAPEKLNYNLILTGASGRWVVTEVTAVPVSK